MCLKNLCEFQSQVLANKRYHTNEVKGSIVSGQKASKNIFKTKIMQKDYSYLFQATESSIREESRNKLLLDFMVESGLEDAGYK